MRHLTYKGPLAHLQGCGALIRFDGYTKVLAQFDKACYREMAEPSDGRLDIGWHTFTRQDFGLKVGETVPMDSYSEDMFTELDKEFFDETVEHADRETLKRAQWYLRGWLSKVEATLLLRSNDVQTQTEDSDEDYRPDGRGCGVRNPGGAPS